ncbi:hypothetical protein CEXT_332391 [Caerostris extrusa]|uniref:Uncharacterized protein n=1 Tax=Caerostris extrusa TaxID=172846 RepID=A0AAV4XIN0_CAEEX|nr:hypothetical protein CEXT_332391 [Caerostris extrusa]
MFEKTIYDLTSGLCAIFSGDRRVDKRLMNNVRSGVNPMVPDKMIYPQTYHGHEDESTNRTKTVMVQKGEKTQKDNLIQGVKR